MSSFIAFLRPVVASFVICTLGSWAFAEYQSAAQLNFVHAAAIGLCLSSPALKILQKVPLATLSGLFLFMGMGCFAGNGFVNRCLLPLQDPKRKFRFRSKQGSWVAWRDFGRVFPSPSADMPQRNGWQASRKTLNMEE